jgi:hypothetical protein
VRHIRRGAGADFGQQGGERKAGAMAVTKRNRQPITVRFRLFDGQIQR